MRALTFCLDGYPRAPSSSAPRWLSSRHRCRSRAGRRSRARSTCRFNRGTVISTAVHEAYPGHYVQSLVQRAPTKVRKLLGSGTNAEGWAHYTEQDDAGRGYGRTPGRAREKDPRSFKLRLGSSRTRCCERPLRGRHPDAHR